MRIRSIDPASGETVFETEAADAKEVGAAVARARAAQPAWAALPLAERVRWVRRFGAELLARADEAARLVTREMGKPLPEAYATDVLVTLDACDWLATASRRVLAPRPVRLRNPLLWDRRSEVTRRPVGVVGVVSPWNYPLAIPATSALYALVAGNAVVLKPAEQTPGTGALLADLARASGLPPDVLGLVQGGPEAGAALVASGVDHVVFTGSSDVGARVAAAGIPCTLELGGSDPALVLEDADLAGAADGILWARFTNAGQTCAATKRVLAHEAVHDDLVARLAEGAKRLRLGAGLDPATDVGPLVSEEAARETEALVEDAVARGARVVAGGRRAAGAGAFFEPTVLADVAPDARLLREESFGPVLPVVRCRDEDEMVRLANDTPFGLSASVWTSSPRRGRRVAERLQAGTVTVNDTAYTYAANETPWGGVKSSGRGVAHGEEGLRAMTRPFHVNWSPSRRLLPTLWWYPYEADATATWRRGLAFLYGGARAKARHAVPLAAALLRKRRARAR